MSGGFDVGTVYTCVNTYSEIHTSQSTLRNLRTLTIREDINAFITVYGREPGYALHMVKSVHICFTVCSCLYDFFFLIKLLVVTFCVVQSVGIRLSDLNQWILKWEVFSFSYLADELKCSCNK